ncbi:chitobiase/beta-hexosaminidase C-terminal domain-containing protein, partial [bacterium]|nr:chitobiase/beta-hexosaminidase C-terminal domain-containing protein [bacterium]
HPTQTQHYQHHLKTLKPGLAYWIMSSQSLDRVTPSHSQVLQIVKPGYSLVYPSVTKDIPLSQAVNIDTITNASISDLEEIWSFDSEHLQFEYYSAQENKSPYRKLKFIKKHHGYWIKTKISNLIWNPQRIDSKPIMIEGGGLANSQIPKKLLSIKAQVSNELQGTDNILNIQSGNSDQQFHFNFDAQSLSKQSLGNLKIDLKRIQDSAVLSSSTLYSQYVQDRSKAINLALQFQYNGQYLLNFSSYSKDQTLIQKEVKIIVERPKMGSLLDLFYYLGKQLKRSGRSIAETTANHVAKIVVTVSGPDFNSFSKSFDGFSSEGNITVSVGQNRHFEIDYLDSHNDIIRKGAIDIDLLENNGQPVRLTPIAIDLQIPNFDVSPDIRQFASQIEVQLTFSSGTLFYTLDGSDPKTSDQVNSTQSSVLLNLSDTTNLKVFILADNGNRGPIHNYTFERTTPPQVFTQISGTLFNQTYLNQANIHFDSDSQGARIFYTSDGSSPTKNSAFGVVPFSRNFFQSVELKYFAVSLGGVQSIAQTTSISILLPPTELVSQLQFLDLDLDNQQIEGTFQFNEVTSNPSITNYLLYYGSSSSQRLPSSLITSLIAGNSQGQYTFSSNTPFPLELLTFYCIV